MSPQPLITVCIPAYSMQGKGVTLLKYSLDILSQQDFQDFEVVVSDQSDDEDIRDLCDDYTGMLVRHIWTRDAE